MEGRSRRRGGLKAGDNDQSAKSDTVRRIGTCADSTDPGGGHLGLAHEGFGMNCHNIATVAVLTKDQLQLMLVEAAELGVRRAVEARAVECEWMSKEEVAKMLDYKVSYIPELARQRGLPHIKVGRKFRFRRADVEAWARMNRSVGQ